MQNNTDDTKEKKSLSFYIRIGGTLFLICAIVAVLLAGVNALTADRILENESKETENAVKAIFSEADSITTIETAFSFPVKSVYLAKKGEALLGYCANVAPLGYSGAINMMVGVDSSKTVVDVKIIALSETPGLGSKVKDATYLSSYQGKSHEIMLNQDGGVDAVSGATTSSKAVLSGVNAALALFDSLKLDFNAVPIPQDTEKVEDVTIAETTVAETTRGEEETTIE